MPPLNLYARVRISLCSLHTRPRVQRAPGFPCALCDRGRKVSSRLGRIVPRECGFMFLHKLATVIASEAKQSIAPLALIDGLLRFARNDVEAAVTASRS